VLIVPTGTGCQAAGMVIMKERCQPLTQYLHVAENHHMLCFVARTASIMPVCAIQSVLHLVLLTV
jgi:hypothetical protein